MSRGEPVCPGCRAMGSQAPYCSPLPLTRGAPQHPLPLQQHHRRPAAAQGWGSLPPGPRSPTPAARTPQRWSSWRSPPGRPAPSHSPSHSWPAGTRPPGLPCSLPAHWPAAACQDPTGDTYLSLVTQFISRRCSNPKHTASCQARLDTPPLHPPPPRPARRRRCLLTTFSSANSSAGRRQPRPIRPRRRIWRRDGSPANSSPAQNWFLRAGRPRDIRSIGSWYSGRAYVPSLLSLQAPWL